MSNSLRETVQEESEIIFSKEDLESIDLTKVPRHVAIIPDGNRRWAKMRGLPSLTGHWKGVETLIRMVRAASELGIKTLTVYAFSTENWNRSKEEVEGLMQLYARYLEMQREPMMKEGVRLFAIGDHSRLPDFLLKELEISQSATAHCKKIDLVLPMNYGGRDDIRRAFIAMARDIEQGKLSKEQITEVAISRYLDTSKWPDPDLLIRPGGEKRQSNFLLWQLSYSEFHYTDVLWPDFDEYELLRALRDAQARQRRLGG